MWKWRGGGGGEEKWSSSERKEEGGREGRRRLIFLSDRRSESRDEIRMQVQSVVSGWPWDGGQSLEVESTARGQAREIEWA